MLESIVEQNGLRFGETHQDLRNRIRPFFADSNGQCREFLFELQGFIAHIERGIFGLNETKTNRLPPITTTQNGNRNVRREQTYQIFGVRRLARAARREVADANGRHVEPR